MAVVVLLTIQCILIRYKHVISCKALYSICVLCPRHNGVQLNGPSTVCTGHVPGMSQAHMETRLHACIAGCA